MGESLMWKIEQSRRKKEGLKREDLIGIIFVKILIAGS